MITKTPFIESYLEQFGDDKEIKKLIETEKCKIVPYINKKRNKGK